MTTILCFLTIKYELSNTFSHVCFEKNAKKLRICAQLTQSGYRGILLIWDAEWISHESFRKFLWINNIIEFFQLTVYLYTTIGSFSIQVRIQSTVSLAEIVFFHRYWKASKDRVSFKAPHQIPSGASINQEDLCLPPKGPI